MGVYRRFLLLPVVAFVLLSSVQANSTIESAGYTTLTSEEGRSRLASSLSRTDFLPLSTTFLTQERQTLCSVATGVMVLNAMPIEKPIDPFFDPYPIFTQRNYFTPAVNKIISREKTLKIGMTLEEVTRVLRTHGVSAQRYHAADSSLAEFRKLVSQNLGERDNYVIINYRREYVGQPKGAHFSPLAAYDEATDSFLIMDVARYKFPPVWVKAGDLWNAMNTTDSVSMKSRGYILVNAPQNQ